MDLRDDARGIQDDLVNLRRQLHRIPEVGLDIPRTQEMVLSALAGLPLEISTGSKTTSVIGVLRGDKPGPTVLLRGDMDALPVIETLDIPYKSDNGNMHACGHDLHTSMLVGAARVLSGHKDKMAGDVIFMFQPGEESYDGAGVMISEGVLEASGTAPSAAYALHVTSAVVPRGVFATRAGTVMAAADKMVVTVRGAGGHGSAPHRALDPIPAACEMVTALQTFVTRSFDVFDPVVITVGAFHAGSAHNVIPETATFEATMRSFSETNHQRILEECVRVINGIAAAHRLEVDVEARSVYPVTVNDVGAVDLVNERVSEVFGDGGRFLELPFPLTGSEDFSRVLQAAPGAMIFLGAPAEGADPLTAPFNHSPYAAFDDAVLADGSALYADLAMHHLLAR